jgi:hypothetical protein
VSAVSAAAYRALLAEPALRRLAIADAFALLGAQTSGARTSGARTSPGRLPRLLACYAGGLAALTAARLYPPLFAAAAPLAGLSWGRCWPPCSAGWRSRRSAVAAPKRRPG